MRPRRLNAGAFLSPCAANETENFMDGNLGNGGKILLPKNFVDHHYPVYCKHFGKEITMETMTQSIEIMDQIAFRLKMTPDEKERYLWLALAGEVGEALNLVKKQWRDDFEVERLRKLKMELADVYIYLRVLEAFYGMNVHQWALEKMKEVEKRPFATRPTV